MRVFTVMEGKLFFFSLVLGRCFLGRLAVEIIFRQATEKKSSCNVTRLRQVVNRIVGCRGLVTGRLVPAWPPPTIGLWGSHAQTKPLSESISPGEARTQAVRNQQHTHPRTATKTTTTTTEMTSPSGVSSVEPGAHSS